MSKLLCFIYPDMADFELIMAATSVSWLEKEIVTIAYTNEVVISKPGIQYQPHLTVKEALLLEDVDGIIIPGGWNNEQRTELTELIQKLDTENKLIAAICAGPQFLAKAGILTNRHYTTTLTADVLKSRNEEDFFPRSTFVSQNVVRDGHVITAIGRAFIDFAMEILDYFNVFDNPNQQVDKTQLTNHYKGL